MKYTLRKLYDEREMFFTLGKKPMFEYFLFDW